MVDAHAHPSRIAADIVDPVRGRTAQFLVDEVMHPHLFGASPGPQFVPAIPEVAHQLVLFGIDGDDWLLPAESPLHLTVEMFELSVAIRMAGAFPLPSKPQTHYLD